MKSLSSAVYQLAVLALLALILAGAVVNLLVELRPAPAQNCSATPQVRRTLACEALPIRFITTDPECADRLLLAMNVSNVRIIAPQAFGNRSPAAEDTSARQRD